MSGTKNMKSVEGRSWIDCLMITFESDDGLQKVAITSGTKLGVEILQETTDAVKNLIKSTVVAQKPEVKTTTGSKLTITDNLVILDMLEILQGGTIARDESGQIVSYSPPASGKSEGKRGTFRAYTAEMVSSDTVGFICVSYPGCKGEPVSLNFEDNVFQTNEYTIVSTPGTNQPPYLVERVKTLPNLENGLSLLVVNSTTGSAAGKTVISALPTKSPTNTYMTKQGATLTLPAYDEVCSTGFTAWDGVTEITGTTGQKIMIVEIDAQNKAKSAGIATIAAKV